VVLAIPTAPQIAPRDAVMRDLAPAVLSSKVEPKVEKSWNP
jgi:hypothetical protein